MVNLICKSFCDRFVGEQTPENESVQPVDFQCHTCFEVYHIISFLQEIQELEHAMLLTENNENNQSESFYNPPA